MRVSALALLLAAIALACGRGRREDAATTGEGSTATTKLPLSPALSPAGAGERGEVPTPTATPTAKAPSAAVLLRAATAVEPGGRVPLAEGETVVDPAARFEVELAARCADARLVLLDAQDALVPASSASEVGTSTKLTLAPSSPLRPASRYVLRVDGATSRELHDADGHAFGPASRQLLVAGTPPPPEPKKASRRRRR